MGKRKTTVPPHISYHWRFLHHDCGKTWREISEMKNYHCFSKATICRHMVRDPMEPSAVDRRKFNKGRPKKLTPRDERNILRECEVLRQTTGHFTVKRVLANSAIKSSQVCLETIRRVLRRSGMRYCHSRKKGVLLRKDLKCRLKFARKIKRLVDPSLWTSGISFYLDGVGFTHKTNPFDQAMSPRSMMWRKPQDGLCFQKTSKGSHEGSGGKVAHFWCAIAYGKGVILAEQYHGTLTGESFADFVRTEFPTLFDKSANVHGRLFLQDGDPSQNSRLALDAIDEVGGRLFHIPPRSPDINPIENIFNCVKAELKEQAINQQIKKETYRQYCARVKQTLLAFPIETIDRTIAYMDKRIDLIIKHKGQRIKY